METTLTLDDEVVEELKEVADRAGKPFTDVVNETLRKGPHPPGALSPKPYRLESVSLGVRPGVDIDKARHLADALEDEEILRKLAMGK
jgi:DNA polymerase III epsilon subunit-like protein